MKRIEWVDIAKFMGMFFIYLGHFGKDAGLAYYWVFSFHVPLFFFLSGCLENYNHRGIVDNIWHKFVNIVVPFFFFLAIVAAFDAANSNSAANIKKYMLVGIQGGIRTHVLSASALWFLTCLFVMEIMFSFIKRVRYKSIVFIVCLFLFFITEDNPRLYWNLDTACYYLIYFGIGWLCFGPMNKLLCDKSRKCRYVCFLALCICAIYSSCLFFGKDLLAPIAGLHVIASRLCGILRALFSIGLVILISNYLSDNEFIKKIGRNSLYLCGNEFIIKKSVRMVLSMVGLKVKLSSPIQYYLYTLTLLILADRILIPLEKPVLTMIQGKLHSAKNQKYEASVYD